MLHAIEDAQRSETANRKVPAFGGTPRADVAGRSAIPRRELGNEAAVQLTRPAVAPRAELRQPALFDELTEMLPKADRVRPVKTGPANEPAELHAWSRLPGWPDSVVGRRVRWNERWGKVTKTERGGRSVFFREEVSGRELELSAEFIRMRSGTA